MAYTRFLIILLLLACHEEGQGVQPDTEQGKFKNPVLASAPDPWVVQKNDWYYFTHTTGNSIRLYRTRKMSDLSQADVKTIWFPPASGMNSRNIWAPEFHFVNEKWYCYYAADNGLNENHRIWVLENSSQDPFTGTWTDKGELELPDDKWAIDGTIFVFNNKLYFLWSGWEGDTNVEQNIYIAPMTDPLTVSGPRVELSSPELSWEKQGAPPGVNEGPQFLAGDNNLHITYSASGCWTDSYSLGLLTAAPDADLLNPESWVKTVQPVFSSNASGQAFAPGHNSFFKSPDGTEDWLVYHANSTSGAGCSDARSFRIQKFTWNDGFPVFGAPIPLNSWLQKPSGED